MRKSFTLVEVMIVVAIIALIAAIAIPNLLRARVNANDARARAHLHGLVTAIESYAATEGSYPTSESEIVNITPPYLSTPVCGQYVAGYSFSCTWGGGTYSVSAAPPSGKCNVTGTKNWTVTAGNVWTESGC